MDAVWEMNWQEENAIKIGTHKNKMKILEKRYFYIKNGSILRR